MIDIDKNALKMVPKRSCIKKKCADVCKIPYKDNYFDIVTSFDVFEHIDDDVKAVFEIKRVFKKNGLLIFTVPAFQFIFSAHDIALEHKRRYSKESIKKLLKDFDALKINYWNFISFIPAIFRRFLIKTHKPQIDRPDVPNWINEILFNLLKTENKLIKYNFPLPIGLSIIGWCNKRV